MRQLLPPSLVRYEPVMSQPTKAIFGSCGLTVGWYIVPPPPGPITSQASLRALPGLAPGAAAGAGAARHATIKPAANRRMDFMDAPRMSPLVVATYAARVNPGIHLRARPCVSVEYRPAIHRKTPLAKRDNAKFSRKAVFHSENRQDWGLSNNN